MKKLSIVNWVLIFAMLLSYSVVMFQSRGSEEAAYAHAAEHAGIINTDQYFMLIKEKQNSALERVMDRLQMRADVAREMCSITEDEYEELSGKHNLEATGEEVNGNKLYFVDEPHNGMSSGELEQSLGRSLGDCIRMDTYDYVIMVLSAHLS